MENPSIFYVLFFVKPVKGLVSNFQIIIEVDKPGWSHLWAYSDGGKGNLEFIKLAKVQVECALTF